MPLPSSARQPWNGFSARPLASPQAWRSAGREPELAELLADPLVHLVMRRDGVTLPQLRALLAEASARRARRLCGCRLA